MKLGYPLKHWLTSLIIAPLTMILYDTISSSKLLPDTAGVYFLFIPYGLLFSLPVFGLYLLIFNMIIKTDKSSLTIKVILDAIAIIGVVATFSLIGDSIEMKLSIFYSVALVIASTFFRVRPRGQLV
jgi:hypothetical protein